MLLVSPDLVATPIVFCCPLPLPLWVLPVFMSAPCSSVDLMVPNIDVLIPLVTPVLLSPIRIDSNPLAPIDTVPALFLFPFVFTIIFLCVLLLVCI